MITSASDAVPPPAGTDRMEPVPYLVIDHVDAGPPELSGQLPLRCDLVRPLRGPDGAEHYVLRPRPPVVFYPRPARPRTPEQDLPYRQQLLPPLESFDVSAVHPDLLGHTSDQRPMVTVPTLVVGARQPGGRLGPQARGVQVNVAYLVNAVEPPDGTPDFRALFFAAVARVSMVDEPAQAPAPPADEPFARAPEEFPALMLPTDSEQARIDAMIEAAIRTRDAIPFAQRVRNDDPRYNKQFGPAVPENQVTQADLDRYRAILEREHR
jgi:hypothetical protein